MRYSKMAKLAFLSDIHLSSQNPLCRKDDLREVQWLKLAQVYSRAIEDKAKAVVVAGDFVDVACSWTLLPKLANFLNSQRGKIETLAVFGQHDTYMYDATGRKKTIVGSLAEAGLIRVLGEEPLRLDNWADGWSVYGASYGQQPPKPGKGSCVLVIHAPISNQELWAGQNYFDAKKYLAEHPGYKLIVCGDIHRSFDISLGSRRIINTGPLLRRKADEADQQPHFYTLSLVDETIKKISIDFSAAEDVISREHLERERAYDKLIESMQTPQQASLDSSTEIKFSDTLNEVAAANRQKITPSVVRLLSAITGVTLEETKRADSKQKAAAKAGRSSHVGDDRTQPKGQSKNPQRTAGKTSGRSKS